MYRKNSLSLDGVTIEYSALTVAQVREYLAPMPAGTTDEKYVERQRQMVCNSLNNLNAAADAGCPYTVERLERELDLVLISKLHEEIVWFSGLKIESPDTKKQPGEFPAAAPPAAPLTLPN